MPKFIGRRVFRNFDLAELVRYIDWGPLFQTWDLHGPFPQILADGVLAPVAREVDTARRLVRENAPGRRALRGRR